MANASAKRIAAQNEVAIRNLRIGMIVANSLYFLIRLVLPSRAFPPTGRQLTLYVMTTFPEFVLFRHLSTIGSPRRDPTTGTLIAAGEDLAQPGITEYCWDVIYITWLCQIGSALVGEFFWWFYLVIPLYAAFKIYTSFLAPMFGFGSSKSATPVTNGTTVDTNGDGPSKKQQKLQKRAEKRGGAPEAQAQAATRIRGKR